MKFMLNSEYATAAQNSNEIHAKSRCSTKEEFYTEPVVNQQSQPNKFPVHFHTDFTVFFIVMSS